MILEQKFLESDLIEAEQVFAKSVRSKHQLSDKAAHFREVIAYTCVVILFGCSLAVTILTGEISKETVLYAFIGGLGALVQGCISIARRKLKLINIIKRKYGKPFSVTIKDDLLVYKQVNLFYEDIKAIAEYKNLLFIVFNRRWALIKVNDQEKEMLISKIREKKAVSIIQKEEPFDLRELI